jgi:hypothetical protein
MMVWTSIGNFSVGTPSAASLEAMLVAHGVGNSTPFAFLLITD